MICTGSLMAALVVVAWSGFSVVEGFRWFLLVMQVEVLAAMGYLSTILVGVVGVDGGVYNRR